MREHADKMTAEVQRLSEQLTKAVDEQRRLQEAMQESQERTLAEVQIKLEHFAMAKEWVLKRFKDDEQSKGGLPDD
jgi:hypothetical protein